MKKVYVILLLALFSGMNPTFLSGQGVTGLEVVSMPGFPDLPLDTAYEGQSYTFDVLIRNNTNIALSNATIEVQLKADSLENTIATAQQVNLNTGDTLILTLSGYNFTQAAYAAGNNIVVVWPRIAAPASSLPADTFYTNVYFVPLNSLDDGKLIEDQAPFTLYPNPATGTLQIMNDLNLSIEHVRIFDNTGKLFLRREGHDDFNFDVSYLPAGMYWLVGEVNKREYYLKFLVR